MGVRRIYSAFSLVILSLIAISNGQFVNISTASGVVRGIVNSDVTVFSAIPFGAPPVGKLRFQKPQKVLPWDGVFDATQQGNICIQFINLKTAPPFMKQDFASKTQSEDCLNLDVFVPRDLSANKTGSLYPVLVFFHGGGFKIGSRVDHDSTLLARRGDMIVVSVNYRLGSLGFLALEHPEVAGNAGLLDQTLALEWVRDNIKSFGGNPNKVTIYGGSAGSFAVSLHLLSPVSKGLFHGAIMNSGMYFDTLLTTAEAAETSVTVSVGLGCNVSSLSTVLQCLRALNTSAINDAFNEETHRPFVDGTVVPVQPSELVTSGKFNRVPVMAGFNSEDGSTLMNPYGPKVMATGLPEMLVDDFINERVFYTRPGLTPTQREAASALAKALYFPMPSDPLRNLRSALDFTRDIYWTAPAIKLAKWFSKVNVPVYLYMFDEKSLSRPFGSAAVPLGARHGDDVNYVFGKIENEAANPLDYTPLKLQFVLDLMGTWSDFVHTGKPSLMTTRGQELDWKAYTEKVPTYAILRANVTTVAMNPAPMADNVWNNVLGPLQPSSPPCPSMYLGGTEDNPEVITESGKVRGVRFQNAGINWETYYNIPYAAPPVGDLRFRRTQPVQPWTGTRNGTGFGPACPQHLPENFSEEPPEMSEDCLTLNVWVPYSVGAAKVSPLPIMVYVHGGSYTLGHSRLDMAGLAVHGNIIVVSLQYRLGLFGFLSSGNSTAPGNLALWDILQALEWVRVNGGHFGGDVTRVTLGGHSAGAGLATMLMLSPRVTGLFNNVFAMSGSAIGSGSLDRKPMPKFDHLMKKVGCGGKRSIPEKVECVRGLDWKKLHQATKDPALALWMPVVDGVLLPDTPYNLRLGFHYKNINFIGGTLWTEGEWIGGKPPQGMTYKDFLMKRVNSMYPNSPSIAPAVVQFYKLNGTDDGPKYVQFVRDESFIFGIESLAKALTSNGGKAYIYVAEFTPEGQQKEAKHGDELPLFAGVPLMNFATQNFSSDQVDTSDNFVKYFSNFVATGNPNNRSSVPIEWPPYTTETGDYIMISKLINFYSYRWSQRTRQMDFFESVVPLLINKGDTCMSPENIVQNTGSIGKDGKWQGKDGNKMTCALTKKTGLFDATRDQIDIAVIVLMAACGFLLLLTFILIIVLCKKSAGSSPKAYDLSNGRSNSAVSF